ncbi:hypothetical protein ACTFIY_003103 [Dictyostelium cf. discoideum]
MSFKLSWGGFDEKFYETLKTSLNTTLNSGPPIPNITDKLLVHNIHLGDIAPNIQLLEVDPSINRLKFVFKIKYNGNGLLELRTMVQANPIYMATTIASSKQERELIKRFKFGSAANPHIVPLSITIRDIEFDGVLSVSILNNDNNNIAGSAGGSSNSSNSNSSSSNNNNNNNNKNGGGKIEAFFTEDPLKKVNIVTSFDDFPAAAKFVSTLVEGQLRDFITKEFPTIVGSITIPVGPTAVVPTTTSNEITLLPTTTTTTNNNNIISIDNNTNNSNNNNNNNNSPNLSTSTSTSSSPQLSFDGSNNSSINSSPQLISITPLPISPLLENNKF